MARAEAAASDALIAVEVVFAAAPHDVRSVALRLPAGATALDALRASGLTAGLDAILLDGLSLALWGRHCEPGTLLRHRDRLELLRALQVDPKEARRLRYRRDGLRRRVRGGKSTAAQPHPQPDAPV
jgi:hypothetical protein